ncbi:hypothetical protein BVRB_6g156260 [Beta vulgaris subsp. vulgaris]|uniref:Uncharacterized protein n=1 Tax=Beta vulgaris subsp. vulgaris TaxID=3555 RepID=A0A0J8BBD0_BETVV|nr:hypothetical protein BVRB_6g156260 [Beta vulgaris subsp. vulgaris]
MMEAELVNISCASSLSPVGLQPLKTKLGPKTTGHLKMMTANSLEDEGGRRRERMA